MNDLKNKILSLFFTGGVSLKDWDEFRNLEREAKRYGEFAGHFKKIYFFTYGDKSDKNFKREKFPENLIVFPKKWRVLSKYYSFLLPFAYKKEISGSSILKTNQMNGSWAAVIAKKIYGGKLVVRCGFEWLRFCQFKKRNKLMLLLIRLLENLAYKTADLIILPTKEDKEFVIKGFKIPEHKIAVIPNHIDIDFFKPLPVEKEKNRIVVAIRLEKQKNVFALIEAVSRISEVKLVIFGDGSLRTELENFAKKLNAAVEFKGKISQENLPEELNKSQVFVQPSFFEGSPKSLLEAMACGLPCIGAKVPGIKDVLIHKENGYLCDTDSDSLQKAIGEVLRDKKLQKKIGQAARETIEEKFSFEKICRQELRLLESLFF